MASERSSLPWSHWMRRYVAANSLVALDDLIWSVGGSPPYGGVSYEEAEAVYNLLEAYKGPGQAPESLYAAVEDHLGGRPDAVLALEVFRIHDRVASDPLGVSPDDVSAGMSLAEQLDHPGLQCYFAMLSAQLHYQREEVADAKEIATTVLPMLATLAQSDPVYAEQLIKTAVNTASFSALEGDFDSARTAARVLEALGQGHRLGNLRTRLLGT